MERLTRCVLKLDDVLDLLRQPDTSIKQFVEVKKIVYSLIDYVLEHSEFNYLVSFLVMRLNQINQQIYDQK
jgi:hypothetical protein